MAEVRARRVFGGDDASRKQIVLPWKTTLRMSWMNIYNRMGRFLLIFLGIAVVVAFLISSFTYNSIVSALSEMAKEDVHARAVLERAGVFTSADDPGAMKQHADQETWLMVLSCVLCVVVITNTMLMSVTERVSEIGTLKCLGALDRFIVRMFLVESVFIGVVASAGGVLVGYLLTFLQAGATFGFGMLARAVLGVGALRGGHAVSSFLAGVPLGLGVGTVLTVAAAAYPAYVAAKMRPVDAMRVEV